MTRNGLLGLCILLAMPAAAHADLLDDGGFELATSGTQTSNSAWVLTVNFPDGLAAAAQFETAAFASNPGGTGLWFRSFEGEQAMGDPPADAELVQVVANVDGGDFGLTFFAKREANFTAAAWVVTLSSSGAGGSQSVDLMAAAPADGNWYNYALALSGVAPGDDLTVTAAMADGTSSELNPQSAFVDSFELVQTAAPFGESRPVPALGLTGLLLLIGTMVLLAGLMGRKYLSPAD